MIWSGKDELALAECRNVAERCQRRFIKPAPYFLLAVRMYEELEKHGLIDRTGAEEGEAYCRGCEHEVPDGGCARAYQQVTLSLDGTEVVRCALRRRKAL